MCLKCNFSWAQPRSIQPKSVWDNGSPSSSQFDQTKPSIDLESDRLFCGTKFKNNEHKLNVGKRCSFFGEINNEADKNNY